MNSFIPEIDADTTWDDLMYLVQAKVQESQRLELKAQLPDRKEPQAEYTIRKDAVAMANGGGGVLLYGVGEEGSRAGRLLPVDRPDDAAVRLRDVLAHSIEPPLRPEVFQIRNATNDAVLVVKVDGGPPRALVLNKDKSPEYWIRRDTSVRPMTPMELAHSFRSERAQREDQLAPLAIWEMSSIRAPLRTVFMLDDQREFTRYFDETGLLLERSGDSPLVLEELGRRWARGYTDAVRVGGHLRNYREAAARFVRLLRPEIATSEADLPSDSVRAAWASFRRVVDLGFAYSYEGSRRLGRAELLIALGASLLGEAIEFARAMNAQDAAAFAIQHLDEQAKYYDGELADCFAYVRRETLSDTGPRYEEPPLLLARARDREVDTVVQRPSRTAR